MKLERVLEISRSGRKPNPSDYIRATYELLSRPGVRLQGPYAVDESGAPVCPASETAQRFCLMGGLHRASLEIERAAGTMTPEKLNIYRTTDTLGAPATNYLCDCRACQQIRAAVSPEAHRALVAVREAAKELGFPHGARFNDHLPTTTDEVLGLLDEVAMRLEREEAAAIAA